MTKNLREIGISRDPNELLAVPSSKQNRLKMIKLANGFIEEDMADEQQQTDRPKSKVVEQLEREANELRESQFR